MNSFTKGWILSIPKTINENGCWIPMIKPNPNGYVQVKLGGRNGKNHYLHRIAMCLYYNVNYENYKIEAMHNTGCDRACFWHEHLKPGTHLDNIKVRTQNHIKQTKCSKCGGAYNYTTLRVGDNKGQIKRYCPVCQHKAKKLWRLKMKLGSLS